MPQCSRRTIWVASIAGAAIFAGVIAAVVVVTTTEGRESTATPASTKGACNSQCRNCESGPPFPVGQQLPAPSSFSRLTAPWYIRPGGSNLNQTSITADGSIQVTYRQGEWAATSGSSFKSNPFRSLPAYGAVLTYSVYFPPTFPWAKGGKLPGLCIGQQQGECATGGKYQQYAGSVRMMWRDDGRAIGYVYLPLSVGGGENSDNLNAWKAQGKGYRRVSESTGKTGENLFCKTDGGMQLQRGVWNNVSMLVALGKPGIAEGVISLSVNGQQRTVTDVLFRTTPNITITDFLFVSFYGGGEDSWAAPADTFSQYRDFSFASNPNVSMFRSTR